MCKSVNILVFRSYQCCAGALRPYVTGRGSLGTVLVFGKMGTIANHNPYRRVPIAISPGRSTIIAERFEVGRTISALLQKVPINQQQKITEQLKHII